ncbi:XRE family transcriptional regulator [Campylobacter sp. RM16192]|uniref:XRE family transcriptional regulator n=1 Tax=Campylobacter sp. RM16192 TaxID=1660080 RepID=UPI00145292D3|nr:XRE family transcriptional regulator [Campylobacter sp. RM16192]QCD52823.1 peptidase S24 LexA-like protein [Campylobacter sp. RM16192]
MAKIFNYKRLKELMREKKIQQKHIMFYLAEKGVIYSDDGIKNWFRTDETQRRDPEMNTIKLLAEFFMVSIDELIIGSWAENIFPLRQIPIVGSASCGIPENNALQEANKYTYCNEQDWNEEVYAVIANGDSMAPTIEEGDEVMCDPRAEILDGDIVHYEINGECAIKTYKIDSKNKKILFIPINKSFKTKEFDENTNIRMVKVMDVRKSLKNNRKERLRALGFK